MNFKRMDHIAEGLAIVGFTLLVLALVLFPLGLWKLWELCL